MGRLDQQAVTLAELEAAGWTFVGVIDEGNGKLGEWREILIKRPVTQKDNTDDEVTAGD